MITLDLHEKTPTAVFYSPLNRVLSDVERAWLPIHEDIGKTNPDYRYPTCPICVALASKDGVVLQPDPFRLAFSAPDMSFVPIDLHESC